MPYINTEHLFQCQTCKNHNKSGCATLCDHGEQYIPDMKKIPEAEVEEVRHGEWLEWWDDNYLSYCHKCSECEGYPLTKEETMHDEVLSAYCPHCGAKMDGESK